MAVRHVHRKEQNIQPAHEGRGRAACRQPESLDEAGHIELAGVFKGYPGVAGMYILRAESYEEAEALCQQEPLVAEGFATYKLKALQ